MFMASLPTSNPARRQLHHKVPRQREIPLWIRNPNLYKTGVYLIFFDVRVNETYHSIVEKY